MKIILAAVLAAALASCATPAQRALDARPVDLPRYESAEVRHAASAADYDAARADAAYVMETFTYPSEGLTVGAYVYRPRALGARRLPVIVFNRGGFVRADFAGELLVMAHRFARAGYIVVAPHYRGSVGGEGRDEMGGADLNDLMNLAPSLSRIAGADTSRVYLAGESRGGMMTYQALREGFPARAAAVWGAFTDLEPLIESGPQAQYAPMIWPDLAQNRDAIVERRSALRWAGDIRTPVLIMHGGADADIPPEQSARLDAALTQLGRRHAFRMFEGEGHTISGRAAERDAMSIAWFRAFE